MILYQFAFYWIFLGSSDAAAGIEKSKDSIFHLKEGVIHTLSNGKYVLPKLNVSIITLFASSTITAESDEKFYITFANSTEIDNDKGIWWRALFFRESFLKYKKKVSPFEDLYFKIEFVSDTSVVDTQIQFKAFDRRNICWFIAGIILFCIAKRLSRSELFHYSSGASIGMLMSWMIILVLLYRLLPYRRAMTTLLVTGTGTGFYFIEMLYEKGYNLVLQYPYETISVCLFFGLLSMALIYYFGPPSTDKSYNLIQWSLQACAIYLIYRSSYCHEFSITAIISVITINFIHQFFSMYTVLVCIFVFVGSEKIANFGESSLISSWFLLFSCTPRRIYYYFKRPEQIRLLTMEEYEEQGRVETEKALQQLSTFCNSPDCNSWRVVSKLKNPKRFASFLTDNKQFSDEEVEAYDQFEQSNEYNNLLEGENDSDHSLDSAISETWLTDDDIHRSSDSFLSS